VRSSHQHLGRNASPVLLSRLAQIEEGGLIRGIISFENWRDKTSNLKLPLPKEPSMSITQSTAASVVLVQEIRKIENLQDELGEDVNRALEALQKEVGCLWLAQAGMNHDAASIIKKLQAMRSRNPDDIATLHQSISLNIATRAL
jgi:hypothetical protein